MGEEVKEKKPNSVVEGCKGFCTFLYNPDDHTVLGRGGESWAKIVLFYFFFYAALAGFFAVALTVMLQTLDPDKPTVVGRTNKPKLAIADSRLYTIDFTSAKKWKEYKEGVSDLKTTYSTNIKPDNGTGEWFTWGEASLGSFCRDDSQFVKTGDVKSACFFMGLNRIYDYQPLKDLEDAENSHLSVKCVYDIGKAGDGNLEPAVTMDIFPAFEDQTLELYYPWKSMASNGLQPLVSLRVTVNQAAADDIPNDKLATYIKCTPYIRNTDGTEKGVKEASGADFEVKYPNNNS